MRIEEAYEIVSDLTIRQVEAMHTVTIEHESKNFFVVVDQIITHGKKAFLRTSAKPGSNA